MTTKVAEYTFGNYVLVVTEYGFYMYDVRDEVQVLVDASMLGTKNFSGWVAEISCNTEERTHYSEHNSSREHAYFYAGIGVRKDE